MSERVHRPHTPVLIQLQHAPEQTDKLPPINHVGQLVHRLRERRHVQLKHRHTRTHTHKRLTTLCPGLPKSAGTRKVKTIWILLKQKTVSDSGISWAICKSAPHSRQITMPAPHHSVFYRPDAIPAAKPTGSKH